MAKVISRLPKTLSWRFGLVVLLLAVLSLLLGVETAQDANRNTRCLAQYSARQSEVSSVRSEATAKKDAAVADLLDRVTALILDPPPDTSANLKLRKAAEKYRQARAELAGERAANPLPEFPTECSEVNK